MRIASRTPIWVIVLLYVALMVWCCTMSGCYTPNKAKGQFGKAVSSYPIIGAEFCALTYPVRAKTDSSAYLKSRQVIDSLANVLFKDSLINDTERERLMNEIKSIRNSITQPENCDSLSEGIYRLAAKEQKRGDKFEEAYNRLLLAANNLKPVHDTVINAAEVTACRLDLSAAVKLASDKTIEAKEWKEKAKKRQLIIIGLGVLIALYAGFKIWRATKKLPV